MLYFTDNMMLSVQQESAIEVVSEGHNLLLIGAAGSGKSCVIQRIVEQCRGKGMNVALTCTTGIACSVYPDTLSSTTIHKWSGINDGRHSSLEICDVIKTNPHYSDVIKRVEEVELLIIDECSMLSKQLFDTLNAVCQMRNPNKPFGGIQIVLCGDFQQLPPVPNKLYSDEGEFCFRSHIFTEAISHTVVLTEVHRQSELPLIDAIRQVSSGSIKTETATFIRSLQRPLEPAAVETVKLFATNDLVDDFNRKKVLSAPGTLCEYMSTDSGEERYLSNVSAPRKLWLKNGCPVILLRNISDKLVNGLRGEVQGLTENGPIVYFPSIGVRTPIEKVKFSGIVFSSNCIPPDESRWILYLDLTSLRRVHRRHFCV